MSKPLVDEPTNAELRRAAVSEQSKECPFTSHRYCHQSTCGIYDRTTQQCGVLAIAQAIRDINVGTVNRIVNAIGDLSISARR